MILGIKDTLSMYKLLLLCSSLLLMFGVTNAQRYPGVVYMRNIKEVKLFTSGNQQGFALINLGTEMALQLHFDDLDATVKNFNYTYVLCNADWQPATLSAFDYLTGFTQGRINQYRASSVSRTKYFHYQALLPEKSCMPSKPGNYLLYVYLNGDTSKLAFTKRILVLNNVAGISTKMTQPFNNNLFRTHQKVSVVVDKSKLNVLNPQQQLKVHVLQNYRWDNASVNLQPQFIRTNQVEFNAEQDCVFPGGKEYRWADLRSFRFQSERVDSADLKTQPFSVWLKDDRERNDLQYLFYQDLNGFYEVSATDVNNPWWQGDYAKVYFSFTPADNQVYSGKDVYLVGEMLEAYPDQMCKMDFNTEKRIFEKQLLLKQGYYSYTYGTLNTKPAKNEKMSPAETEGNFWETENTYTILVYYRSLSGRFDELVGATTINSRQVQLPR